MSDALNDQKEFDKIQWRRETHPEHFNNLHDDNKYRVPKTGTYMVGNQKVVLAEGEPVYVVPDKQSGGTKHDQGKTEYHYFSPIAFEKINQILTFGAKKYAAHNWRGGFVWSRPFNACMRHLWAWWRGEDKDPETGLSHLAHAACCIMFLLEFEETKKDMDDRYKQPEIK